jgi:predicted nucleic acid-binding protein
MSTFLDTNVLLYSLDTTPAGAHKRQVAIALLNKRDNVLSVQVLQEFYVQATHTRRTAPLSHAQATALMAAWRRYPVVINSLALLDASLAIKAAAGLSLWDALIVAAAAEANCAELLTEDLNAGQVIVGVRIVNPFTP